MTVIWPRVAFAFIAFASFGRKYDIIHTLSPKLIRSKKSCRRAIGNDADLIAVRRALGNRRKSEAFEGRGR